MPRAARAETPTSRRARAELRRAAEARRWPIPTQPPPALTWQARLARLALGPTSYTVEVDTQRCGGMVLEAATYSDADDVLVYYYGCDDFVLPAPLPEL